ncbi:hypothetical protein LEMLEM_LOCUS7560 [Lemmus lemmus]
MFLFAIIHKEETEDIGGSEQFLTSPGRGRGGPPS